MCGHNVTSIERHFFVKDNNEGSSWFKGNARTPWCNGKALVDLVGSHIFTCIGAPLDVRTVVI